MTRRFDGLVFDKDGTLFAFGPTWEVWAQEVLAQLSRGDGALAARLGAAIGFDLSAGRFAPDSPVIAGTNAQIAALLADELPGRSAGEIELYLVTSAASAPLAEAVPLAPFLAMLAAQDLALGVMTNDSEQSARAQLGRVGVLGMFDFVAGADSGFGAKPLPGPLLAFAEALGLEPERVVMVGDSTHDLHAGRAAGMATVGVLTGMAGAEELHGLADVILPDIGHLPAWLAESC